LSRRKGADRLESRKCFSETELATTGIDYLKHLTTLASGSVVILATFIDKLQHPHSKSLMMAAVGAFGVSMRFGCGSMLA
jgi:hypothetical protein